MRRMSSFRPKISWITITAGRGPAAGGTASAARIGRPVADGKARSTVAATLRPPERDDVVPEGVDRRPLPRVDDDRRERLLDDRRAEDRLPGRQLRAVVDGRRHEAAAEEGLPRAEPGSPGRPARDARQRGLLLDRHRLHAEPPQDRLLVAG